MLKFKYNYSEIEKINLNKIIAKFGEDYRLGSKGSISYCCPYCEQLVGKPDTKFRLGIDIKTTLYNCFRCHTHGILFRNKLSNSEKIIPFLLQYYTIQKEDKNELNSNKLIEFNNVIPIQKNSEAYKYLKSRNITDEQINYYHLMTGINENLGRIMIPNVIVGKWTDFYQGRSYLDMNPKYLNPDSVDKSTTVFNLYNQSQNQDKVYIVEGVFSAIRAGKDVISIYGSAPSDIQIDLINNYNFKEIYCCLDGDKPGVIGNNKLASMLFKKNSSKIYMVKLPEFKDPADLGEAKFKSYCEKYKKLYTCNDNINKIMMYFDNCR